MSSICLSNTSLGQAWKKAKNETAPAMSAPSAAVTRIRTWVASATTKSTNHYTITAIGTSCHSCNRSSTLLFFSNKDTVSASHSFSTLGATWGQIATLLGEGGTTQKRGHTQKRRDRGAPRRAHTRLRQRPEAELGAPKQQERRWYNGEHSCLPSS